MPKHVVHADRMRAIASAAIEVVAEGGIDGARLRDVAKAAQVTTGSVTHYFDSKDAVLEAALAEIVRRILEGQQTAADETHDFARAIAEFMPNTPDRRRDWKVWFAFWGRAIADERLRRQHRDYYAQMLDNLAEIIGEAQAAGLVRSAADPRLLADCVIATVDGLGIRASLEPDEWPAERQLKTLRTMIEPILGLSPPH